VAEFLAASILITAQIYIFTKRPNKNPVLTSSLLFPRCAEPQPNHPLEFVSTFSRFTVLLFGPYPILFSLIALFSIFFAARFSLSFNPNI